MRSIEVSGKSVDEAIFNGLKQLEISIDEVAIEIIQQETKGILGFGAKPAKVRLTEKEQERISIPDFMNDRSNERSDYRRQDNIRKDSERRENTATQPQRKNDRTIGNNESKEIKEEVTIKAERTEEQKDRTSQSTRKPREYSNNGNNRRQNDQRNRNEGRSERPRRERDERPREVKEQINYTEEAAENNAAAEFLKGLLKSMNIEGKVLANIEEDNVRLRIDSETMGILIGHRGETLDAMQYLTSLAVNRNRKEDGYIRITIDTEGYRDKREETLIRLARKVASQVKAGGRSKALEPMNPYERRVLHSTLQNNPYVTTYSEGEEPNRRVIIAPKEKRQSRQNNGERTPRVNNEKKVDAPENKEEN